MKNYPKSRTKNLVVRKMENEVLVYDLVKNEAICLNKTSAFLWKLCDGKKSIAELSDIISEKLGFDIGEDLAVLALKELKKSDLLDVGSYSVKDTKEVTRPHLITQYGIPMAVLPIVMSVVAPASAQAGSCIPGGQPCVPNPAVPFDNCCPGVGACFSGTCNGGG